MSLDVRGCALAAVLAAALLLCPDAGAADASSTLQQLLAEEWQWQLAEFPEQATRYGEHRYDDRLTDASAPAVAARRAHHLERLARLRAIDRAQLAGEDVISFDVFAFDWDLAVRTDALFESVVPGRDGPWSADDTPFALNSMRGPQLELPQLVKATRFRDAGDYRNYLARLASIPGQLRQLRAQLDAARAAGWMPPKAALGRVPDEFGALLDEDLARHPLYAPFLAFPSGIAAGEREELTRLARERLVGAVIPALRDLRDYLVGVWIPAATETLAASRLPHGAEYYALALERANTTRKSAQEIHELGLREVARLDAAFESVRQEAGFKGTVAEFRGFLRTDPRFQFRSAEEELMTLRDLAKRIDPQLPGLFVELPRLPYGIRAMTPEEGHNAPHYVGGALDGSRAGYFEANTNDLAAWPRWMMEPLVLHEAVPGHHLQIARAHELSGLPALRRAYGNSGYVEGWGLYAESFGRDLGLYADPYARFGRLALEAHRACRLVVDTGLHSLGWSRVQAIDYLVEHAQIDRGFAEAEVDRYLGWPGQATAYKIGELEILALRERAKSVLGARFDLRAYNNAVIDHGALPLPVLGRVIEAWIAAQRARSGS